MNGLDMNNLDTNIESTIAKDARCNKNFTRTRTTRNTTTCQFYLRETLLMVLNL